MALTALATGLALGCAKSAHTNDEDAQLPLRHAYEVQVTGAHAHIYKEMSIPFAVMLLDDCAHADVMMCPMPTGLPVTVFYQHAKDAERTEVSLAPGELEDMGDGTYVWHHVFKSLGAYLIGIEWEQDGFAYSFAFPFETSRAGGERYFCDADADSVNDYSYQIRWAASSGMIMADDTDVKFSFELMRSFNTPLDETSPWTNKFDHLRPSELAAGLPSVALMAGEAASAMHVATLTPTYAGKGVYEVSYAFGDGDLGMEMEKLFWFDVGFTDDEGCVVDGGATDPLEYYFGVMSTMVM